MSRQGKSRRRLLIVLLCAAALAAAVGGAGLYRMRLINQRALLGRENGLKAMEQGDYPLALRELGKYLGRNQSDAAILLPYARARQLVEEPNGRHLGQAIALYQRVLQLEPDQQEAQQYLLDLYLQVGFNTETLSLADRVLERKPDDLQALRARTMALVRMQRFEDAQAAVQKLTAVAPLDLEIRVLELQIMLRLGGQNRLVEHANRLAAEHPGDTRMELLGSIAAAMTGDINSAIRLARPLVTRPQVDAAHTRILVHHLDNLQLFDEAFRVLESAETRSQDPAVASAWIRRLFQSNRLERLLEETASLDPAATGSNVESLALRAQALVRLDRRPEAQAILTALNQRSSTEPTAARWAAVLRASVLRESLDPVESINSLRDALINSANNPVLLQELGEAYAAAGAHDKAAETWREVTRLEPGWAAPLMRLSQAVLASGHPAEALSLAQAAQTRAPQDRDVRGQFIVATAAAGDGPNADYPAILSMIADFQTQFPSARELLPLKAAVLGRLNRRDDALEVFRAALAAEPPPPEKVLISLSQVSASLTLGQEEACFAAAEKAHGLTPDLALARALWLNARQRAPEAVEFLEGARKAHPADDPLWGQVWATWLDNTGDERAKAQWTTLADGHAKDVRVQWGALSARSVQAEHAFLGRTIDRLESLVGGDSTSLSMIRARWLLQGEPKEEDVTQAAILLSRISRLMPESPAPRLLLANCYLKLENTSGAIEQLTTASDLQPQSARIALDLARLLHSLGDFTRARTYIDRATASRQATLNDIRQAAQLLTLQGEYAVALSLLERAYAAAGDTTPDLLLAVLYQQTQQPEKVQAICQKLLEKPDAQSVSFAANFYASRNQMDEAQKALALLDGLELPPGARQAILAGYALQHGTPDEALEHLRAASRLAPGDGAIRRQIAALCLGAGHVDQAITAAEDAARAVTGATGLEVLLTNKNLIHDAAQIDGTRPLLIALVNDPAASAPVLEALRILVSSRQNNEPAARTAAQFRQLADQNARVLPLQMLAMQAYINSGQTDEAVNLASRTVRTFPAAVEPLRVASAIYGAARRWDEQLLVAREWRRLGPNDTLGADLAIAEAQLQIGNVGRASEQIEPYLENALRDPEKYRGVILLRAQSLLANHQSEQAQALLTPLLANSPQWRAVWITLAVREVDNAAQAREWLERVAPMMSADPTEKTVLAQAWIAVARRWQIADYSAIGEQMLQSVALLPDAPVQAIVAWAQTRELANDLTGAEEFYRRALQREPNASIILNNLAFVLSKVRKDLPEARQMIAKALEINPDVPAFLDTQAAVQAALKDYDGAVTSLRTAQRLDPTNLNWRLNLLEILIDAGQNDAARAEVQQVATMVATSSATTPAIRTRLEALRARLP